MSSGRSGITTPEATEVVVDSPDHAVTEDPVVVTDSHVDTAPSTEDAVTTESVDQVGARQSMTDVSLDDFDSDDFLDALKRNKLFTSSEPDDLNIGDADWFLGLNSDAEGDEESILFDEDESDPDDDGASVAQESRSNDESEDGEGLDVEELPVEFELTDEELDQLQADGWDTFDEQHSGQVLLGPMLLYDACESCACVCREPANNLLLFPAQGALADDCQGDEQVPHRQHRRECAGNARTSTCKT